MGDFLFKKYQIRTKIKNSEDSNLTDKNIEKPMFYKVSETQIIKSNFHSHSRIASIPIKNKIENVVSKSILNQSIRKMTRFVIEDSLTNIPVVNELIEDIKNRLIASNFLSYGLVRQSACIYNIQYAAKIFNILGDLDLLFRIYTVKYLGSELRNPMM